MILPFDFLFELLILTVMKVRPNVNGGKRWNSRMKVLHKKLGEKEFRNTTRSRLANSFHGNPCCALYAVIQLS